MGQAWTVVVTTEPEWDAHTAGVVEGLAQHDEDCCPGCGIHKSLKIPFDFTEDHCNVCAARAQHQRVLNEADESYDEKHKNAKPGNQRPYDGRHVHLRPLSPLEVLQRKGQMPQD